MIDAYGNQLVEGDTVIFTPFSKMLVTTPGPELGTIQLLTTTHLDEGSITAAIIEDENGKRHIKQTSAIVRAS